MNIGQLLRASRKSAGLTQEDMSPLVNISRSTISKIERNEMTLATEDFIRWLQVIQVKTAMRTSNTAPLEVGILLINGVDLHMLSDMLTQVVAGLIRLI
ncbi:helix-turn-helix transcriptional regulator [Sporosarcina saromensis]|uniref:Helix-turn-helix transcriptional regulator n=1 Tax=Sporosarcina saromensis TaxID=359365 RepID=A0ABU4G7E3_9BACL|nr:helix-turn-helix transcriptional regulator [Sporosarcina saromensis]MDW0112240.1 helix-turn-helix transcriptional regulator [Sporosarcina saromensis]